MANNYLQFSAVCAYSGEEQRAWWQEVIDTLASDDLAPKHPPVPDWLVQVRAYDYIDPLSIATFQIVPEDSQVWIYAEEYGYPHVVCEIVAAFQEAFQIKGQAFILRWSETCSKMRVEEFSGGAAVVLDGLIGWSGDPVDAALADIDRQKRQNRQRSDHENG